MRPENETAKHWGRIERLKSWRRSVPYFIGQRVGNRQFLEPFRIGVLQHGTVGKV